MAEEVAQLLKQQNQIFAYWAERMGNFQITIPNQATPSHITSQSVPLPPPLCLEGDMEENYTFFESNWKNYAVAVGMNEWPESENKKKVSFLLSVVGTDALKRYFNFELNEAQKVSPETVLEAIRAKVVPVRNIIVDRLDFFSAIQIQTESIDEYVSRLKVLGKPCRFGALEQDMMVFKIVTSNKWSNLKTKMLTMPDINLSKAIDLCRMEEITARHSKQLSLEPLMEVNKVTAQICKFCGGRHPFKRGACPAFGKRCDKCGGKNHFQRVCKSDGSTGRIKGGRNVKAVATSEARNNHASAEDEEQEIWIQEAEETLIGKIVDKSGTGGAVLADLSLKFGSVWKNVSCELDTGALASIIGMDWLKKLSGQAKPALSASRCRLRAFNGTPIEVLGEIEVPCHHKGKRYRMVFQVVNMNHPPLLSVTVCTTLGLVKFCNSVHRDITTLQVLDQYREEAKCIIRAYQDVFEGNGKMEGVVKLEIDEAVKPVIQTPRRIPIAFRDNLRNKIDQLVQDGIIQKETQHTDWVSNLVLVKKNSPGLDSLRLCLDPIPLNMALKRPNLQFTTLDEILPELGRAMIFSTVDAKKGFWQVELDEASSKLTTFWTPFGRYRWLRMPFGISSAPEIFQAKLQETLEGLEGIECLADDILIVGAGDTIEEALKVHNQRLVKLLVRLRNNGVKLNIEKLNLCQTSVNFFGHVLTSEGLKPDERKVEAIQKYPVPTSPKEVHRFVGMINYLARYIPNLSSKLVVLRKLIPDDAPWRWTSEEENEFNDVKQAISEHSALQYYDRTEPLIIECDASCHGLGVAVYQRKGVIGYASRTLTKTEKGYAQIEKELLAIVFACIRFDQLIVGNPSVVVKTDHKPLLSIFKKPLLTAPKRLQHMLLALQRYHLAMQYVKGKDNLVADAISRAPSDTLDDGSMTKQYVYKILAGVEEVVLQNCLSISSERISEIIRHTASDEALQHVMEYIRRGWPKTIDDVPAQAKMYYKYRDELAVQDGIVFRNERITIPPTLWRIMIDRVHIAHSGVEGTLKLARANIFWPGMSNHIKHAISQCDTCAKFSASQCKPPMQTHPIPVHPFQFISMDVFTAYYKGRARHFLVTVDHYSDYFEVDLLPDLTMHTMVDVCKRNFSRHGKPQRMLSDNGSNFVNKEMQQFAKEWDIEHVTSSPYHQQANGKAESAVKIAKKLIKKADDSKQDFWLMLLNWRNTPNKLGSSPVSRLFSRSTRCEVPMSAKNLMPCTVPNVPEAIQANRRRVKYQYDKSTRQLPSLQADASYRCLLMIQQS
ncbi:uncharacterized protein K02A2.6-like [Topomyia yanbarensis]|uniref:uncharacterized protein K02A2.6-like n=1 Tax=Topomyia yanbarensis TaxID=2498891 RepID=UPI00273C3A15|nr:uncharacterized protein K02A2.6-like [Topomyia yanbarensis]